MGIAHHSNYIIWFEVGRTDLCRDAGLTYRTIEDRGYILVVTEVTCRYRTPFHYDDEVHIHTSISQAGSRMMRFDYALHNAMGEVCATGQTRHIWLDRTTRKPVLPPRELLDPFLVFLSP